MTNERWVLETKQTEEEQATISLTRGGGSAKLFSCLVFISFDSSNQYLATKLLQ
jgi:hypothetical protein